MEEKEVFFNIFFFFFFFFKGLFRDCLNASSPIAQKFFKHLAGMIFCKFLHREQQGLLSKPQRDSGDENDKLMKLALGL